MAATLEILESGETSSDGAVLVAAESRRSWGKLAMAGATTGALLLCAGAGAAGARLATHTSAAAPQFNQLEQVVAMPGPDKCASTDEDCMRFGCCDVSGFHCFETTGGKARCMKNCTPGEDQKCTMTQWMVETVLKDAAPVANSFYCFSTYMADTGKTKMTVDELGNLQLQYSRKLGIFQCDNWQVFSDGDAELAPGVPFVKVYDVDGDFHFAKRKETGSWINTGLHAAAWKAIGEAGIYKSADWVMKLDADAVFVPSRLVPILASKRVPKKGGYLENCKYVSYGYFGNLEIFSLAAFKTLVANVDSCKASLPWKIGVKNGKFGPMGEDLFAQQCLDSVGVPRIEAHDISTDGACEADRPEGEKKNKKFVPDCSTASTPQMHPYMTPKAMGACYDATIAAFGA
jgi:hypothetical protein